VHRASVSTMALLWGVASLGTLGIAVGATAEAQQAKSANLELDEIGNSGVSGTAALKDVEGGVEATLDVQGLPEAGVEHLNHFHEGGTCSDVEDGENVPVTIPLDPISANEDGTGSATTTIENVTLDQLFDRNQQRIILVHDEAYEGEGVPPAIACADVNAAGGGQSTTKESTQPLPKSGGRPVGSWLLLPAAALLAGFAVLGYAVLRR
jgi:Cu/Zn superoxide dismutase